MNIGLKRGAHGAEVERLHRILLSRGHAIDRGEVEQGEFGPSTLAALHALQSEHGLKAGDEIDEDTLRILIEFELEQNITININETSPPHKRNPRHGQVHGKLVDDSGVGIADTKVVLIEHQLRSEAHLSERTTTAGGTFAFSYRRSQPINLQVRAYDDTGKVIAQSAIVYAAPVEVEIDLTTAKDGVVRAPSVYTTLGKQVTAQLGRTPLSDLKENKQTHELTFVAKSIGAAFTDVAYLYLANVLAAKNALRDESLFGIFYQGIPASLDSALAHLPDAGIDDVFMAQVMAGVLAQTRSVLARALTTSVAADVLPGSYSDTQDRELSRLDDLRVAGVGGAPYVRGKTSLNDLLVAGAVGEKAIAAFVDAYANNGQHIGSTWKALQNDKSLTPADLAALHTTLSAGEMLGGNLPLVKDTLQRVSNQSLASIQNLALLDEQDWVARITQVDPNAATIPPVLPNETVSQRIGRLAKALAGRFGARWPTTAFAGALGKAESSTTFKNGRELSTFLVSNPTFSFNHANIDHYLVTNKLNLSSSAMVELKAAQRLFRVTPQYPAVDALRTGGYQSAQSIYFRGRTPFLAHMTDQLGSAARAKMAWAQAQSVYATSLMAFGRYNLAINGIGFKGFNPPTPPPGALDNLPSLQALFGSMDYFECEDCQSVYSPAAYLVDLLQYLSAFASQGGAAATALEALLARRPEIQYIALDCSNTNTTLPYIDLVNEILEAAIAPNLASPPPPPTLIDTAGTSVERRALPQNILLDVYSQLTAKTIFPITLPYDLAFSQTSAFLSALGTSLPSLLSLFAGAPAGPSAAAIAGASLSINPEMQAVIDSKSATPWTRWGFPNQGGNSVIDPKTRKPFPATGTTDWITILSNVPILLNRTGLSLQQLYQLLEVQWVTQGAITLAPGTMSFVGVTVLDPDTDNMVFTGLAGNGDALDRANRFLRLWNASGLQMWELDWSLEGVDLDDNFLVFLAGATAVQKKLGLPFQEVLSFWRALETRDVVDHLGDQDTVTPSTYAEVFRNPAVIATPAFAQLFVDLNAPGSDLSGANIFATSGPSPIASAITAALGLSGDDIAAILLATTGTTNALFKKATLNVLLQYQRLASSLSLSISDVVLWIQLTQGKPFGGTPGDTIEFLRRLGVLQGTSIAPRNLDYLLNNGQSVAAQSSIAFTDVQVTAVLQSIHDAIVKLAQPINASDLPTQASIQTVVVNALATAVSITANVVTPLLAKTGALPLPQATINLMLTTTTVQSSQFATLASAFTKVAMGAALFSALAPTESEFAFVVQNAATFGWLDPSALPPPSSSFYARFEALLRALKLDKRQSARAPKLFDVLASWLPPNTLPTTMGAAIGTSTAPALAYALNPSPDDVTAIATFLGATLPSLTAVPGTLSDMAILAGISAALDVAARYKISGATLVQLSTVPATDSTASAAMSALQSQYPQSAWFGAVQPVEDNLRQSRRDALVAYLIGPGAPGSHTTFLSTDDIYDFYLIDPEMTPCAMTTRLLQASLAVQQFVQQCFLNLIFQNNTIDTTNDNNDAKWSEWSWRGQFRLWQANREVFLYPENYVLPETRRDASPFFSDLENDLRQSNLDSDAAQAAYENYLRKVIDVSNLVVAAHYNQVNSDGSSTLHVFAHTRGTPPKWYYRTRTGLTVGTGAWSAWQPLNLDIATDNVVPFVWDQRLHLMWTIFKPQTEKAGNSTVPSGGGGTAPKAQSYWSIELATSELSAGQWQAKKVLAEKLFAVKVNPLASPEVDRPPAAFTVRASQDPSFNLNINVYYNARPGEPAEVIWGWTIGPFGSQFPNFTVVPFGPVAQLASAQQTSPDAPLSVTEDFSLLPASSLIDLSKDPSYSLVTPGSLTGSLNSPTGFGFSGQDLVYGGYWTQNPGSVPLYVLAQTTTSGSSQSIELLQTISNPRIVIPQQELSTGGMDSLDAFFVCDPNRTYFVQPEYFTLASYPVELAAVGTYSGQQWNTEFEFQTFYHPYARTLLRELEIGGLPQLMARNLQLYPQQVRNWPTTFDFGALYTPQPPVMQPYPGVWQYGDPGETWLDFTTGGYGPYSIYNWEVFYHAPMFAASLLMQNNQFQDTMTWLEYIFNPTDSSGGPAPRRFWEFAPFFNLTADDWTGQQISNLLTTLAADTQLGINDAATVTAIEQWEADPFDPHMIASTRISAYAKATVMRFLDNLIAWGDSLFAQYNAETVNQAEQLYVLADMILGPQPVGLRIPSSSSPPPTYASLQNLDELSNVLVDVENVVVAPTSPQSVVNGASRPTLPWLPSRGSGGEEGPKAGTLLFCIPPNTQLLQYWATVADRLYKIRHCQNLQGVVTPLPLYAPPINPLLLVEAGAQGGSISGATPPAPIYRFQTYLQKAIELTNDVRAYGALILSALEKKDAETLAVLRANQEVDIQTRMIDIKTKQVTEAQDQITVLQNQESVVQIRYSFYSSIAFMNDWEIAAMVMQGAALIANGVGIILDMTAGVAHAVPSFSGGAAGFGGSPTATISYGGEQVGSAASSWANVARQIAGLLSEGGAIANTLGGYHRRSDEWQLQANLAQAELTQIASQISAANDHVATAQNELDLQNEQVANAQAVSDFLTKKYTNAQLYDWMITQLTTVYTQAYQLAFGLAQQAQNAYQYELGRPLDSFIQFGYWDSQHKGLSAGESLLFDLRRMEAAYLAENSRELELTKHISLALTQPQALVSLREFGSCQINLDEVLFDRDNPGHYFRRLRSVALTIPCVTGPYTSVNATLSLMPGALVRMTPPISPYTPVLAGATTLPTGVVASATPATSTIATSSGQNDGGLFEVKLHDERWLPFEGQGAISQWQLTLDQRDNAFDLSTVTDVILHVRYTARNAGGNPDAVRAALKPTDPRYVLISVRNTFGDDYFTFFNPTDPTSTTQTLTLPLTDALFPFSNLGAPKLQSITVLVMPTTAQPIGTTLATTFGPTAPGSALPIITVADSSGNPVAAMSSAELAFTPAVAAETLVLSLPSSGVPAPTVPPAPPSLGVQVGGITRLDQNQIDDVLLVIKYGLG